MKKFIVFTMVAAALTIFNGCQNEELSDRQLTEEVQPQFVVNAPMFEGLNNIAFSVEDNRLVFESEEEFQKGIDFLAQIGDENFPEFEEAIGFESYRKVYENDSVMSELFVDELYQVLLNPQKEIVVGNYLFREEPESEQTLAFEYDLENCNLESSSFSPIYTFSWNDDALAILNNEGELYLKSIAGYCTVNKDEKKDFLIKSGNWGNTTYGDPYAYYFKLQAKLCYQKTAIFKSIISKFKLEVSDFQCYNQYWDGFKHCRDGVYTKVSFESVGDAIYKRKGHTMFREPISQFFYPHMSDFETSWRPFYGTRRVECYNITMDFKFNIYNGAVSPHTNGYTKTERLSIYCNQSQCM